MFNQRFEKQMEVLWIPRLKIHCQMLRRPLIPCLRPPIGWGEICIYIYMYDSRYIHFKICLIYINLYTYTYTLRAHHQECIFHMRMRPQKRALVAAPFEHKPTDNSPLKPHVDKLQGDHATRNYCSSNPHVNKGSRRSHLRLRPSHLWLRPSYVRLRPSNPQAT